VLLHAPHRDAAIALEHFAGAEAQAYFANGNNEYSVVGGAVDTASCRARYLQAGQPERGGLGQEPAGRAADLRSRRLEVMRSR
jgi:hypothetical protein